MNETPNDLAKNVTQLVSFPDIALQIDQKLSTDCDIDEIGAIIEPDPPLSAALLRLANSAMYNVGRSISTVSQALMLVGLREARDIAFGVSARSTFDGIPNALIGVRDFWEHSLYCACAAQYLASAAKLRTADSMFTAGLLHDIGQLVMFNQCPDRSRRALQLSLEDNDGLTPHLSEREVFGFDHTAVGAALAETWRFPQGLCACIRWHHDPFAADQEYTAAAAIVHTANSIAVLAELDSNSLDDAPAIEPRAIELLDLAPERITEATETARNSVNELLKLFVS